MPTQYLLRLFCFADVVAEKRVDESLVQTWKLKFVSTFSIRFGQDFKVEVQTRF